MVVAGITRQLVPLSMIAGRYLCVCAGMGLGRV
jgi:hypothetical protein